MPNRKSPPPPATQKASPYSSPKKPRSPESSSQKASEPAKRPFQQSSAKPARSFGQKPSAEPARKPAFSSKPAPRRANVAPFPARPQSSVQLPAPCAMVARRASESLRNGHL